MLPGIVGDCISELYPMFKMKSFKKTAKPKSKDNDDSYNGVVELEGAMGSFNVVSDPTPPQYAIDMMKGMNSRGVTFKFEAQAITGDTPFWTYACPSCDQQNTWRPGEIRYPELYKSDEMAYFRVQIHELGAALTDIRNKYYPAQPPMTDYKPLDNHGLYSDGHEDDGPAMEDCVGRNYYKMNGLTPGKK
jgi:hypothetical protein